MPTQPRLEAHPEGAASSQHISDLLDEALAEGFPASDPVAIHVERDGAPDENSGSADPPEPKS